MGWGQICVDVGALVVAHPIQAILDLSKGNDSSVHEHVATVIQKQEKEKETKKELEKVRFVTICYDLNH